MERHRRRAPFLGVDGNAPRAGIGRWRPGLGAPAALDAAAPRLWPHGHPRHQGRRQAWCWRQPGPRKGALTMAFKRAAQRYGMTPEPVTPYQKAAQVWDERLGSA